MKAETRKPWQVWAILGALICVIVNNEVMELALSSELSSEMMRFCAIISSLSLWGVPLMAIVLGSYYFSGKYSRSLKALWRYAIPAVIISCGFWWIITAIIEMRQNYPTELDILTFLQCLGEVLDAPSNIRFLHMACSVFILYPLLQRIGKNPMVLQYGVVILFIMTVLEPQLQFIPYVRNISLFMDQLNWGFFRAWGFYILAGMYLEQKPLSWKTRLIIYTLGIISAGAVFFLNRRAFPRSDFLDIDSPFSAIQAIAVAILLQQISDGTIVPPRFLRMDGMWTYIPASVVSAAICDRLPLPERNPVILLFARTIVILVISVMMVYVFSCLRGFRRLVGYIDNGKEAQE